MSSSEHSPRYRVDYSKISPDYHDHAGKYAFAREAQHVYAASVVYWKEKGNEVGIIPEKKMEADIEYAIACAESKMNSMIIGDPLSGIVTNAVIDNNYSHSETTGRETR